jgi:hypothetical protein
LLGIDFVKVEVTAGLIAQFNIGSAASTPSGGSVCTCSLQSLMPGASSPATALPTPSQDECALILGIDDLASRTSISPCYM